MYKNLFVALVLVLSTSLFALEVDLRNFNQEGPAGNGNWNVASDGTSVFQSINGNPTFFVGPDVFINKQVKGKFEVETTGDDDFIGFVFGFGNSDADRFFLFDWKQGSQSGTPPGFVLADVSGGASSVPFTNHHLDNTNYDVLATNGTHGGWRDNTEYTFTLTYLADEIKIEMEGGQFGSTPTTIFNFSGQFGARAGRFGFFNFSQSSVRYSGFEEVAATDTGNNGGGDNGGGGNDDPPPLNFFVPETNSFALYGIAGLLAFFVSRKKK